MISSILKKNIDFFIFYFIFKLNQKLKGNDMKRSLFLLSCFFVAYDAFASKVHYKEPIEQEKLPMFYPKSSGYIEFKRYVSLKEGESEDERAKNISNIKKSYFPFKLPHNSYSEIALFPAYCSEKCCAIKIEKGLRDPKEHRVNKLKEGVWGQVLSWGVSVHTQHSGVHEVWLKESSKFYYFLGHIQVASLREKIEHLGLTDERLDVGVLTHEGPKVFHLDKILGRGCQGMVIRAFDTMNPADKVAIKMFTCDAYDCDFNTNLIDNELNYRNTLAPKIIYNKAQTICGYQSLVMEYIEGVNLYAFWMPNNLSHLSHKQLSLFEKDLKSIQMTRDLNGSNLMIQRKEDGFYRIRQIDFALADQGAPGSRTFLQELKEDIQEAKDQRFNIDCFKILETLQQAGL